MRFLTIVLTQLIDTLLKAGICITVLVLQSNGGPDHLLKRFVAGFSLVETAQRINVDHLVVLWCAPNKWISNE
jgi:hypothetical protein